MILVQLCILATTKKKINNIRYVYSDFWICLMWYFLHKTGFRGKIQKKEL